MPEHHCAQSAISITDWTLQLEPVHNVTVYILMDQTYVVRNNIARLVNLMELNVRHAELAEV